MKHPTENPMSFIEFNNDYLRMGTGIFGHEMEHHIWWE
jgi:hypothetical protein